MTVKNKKNLDLKVSVVFGGHSPIAIEISKILSSTSKVIHFTRKADDELKNAFKDFKFVQVKEFNNYENSFIDNSTLVNEPVNSIIFAIKSDSRVKVDEISSFKTEVLFPYYYIKQLVDYRMFKKPASVVFLSSPAADLVLKDQPLIYHLVKSSINQLVRYLSVNYGDFLRINSISPGSFVIKDRNKDYFSEQTDTGKKIREFLPTKVIPTVKDIAQIVNFLVSEEGRILNGENLKLDSGYLNIEISQRL